MINDLTLKMAAIKTAANTPNVFTTVVPVATAQTLLAATDLKTTANVNFAAASVLANPMLPVGHKYVAAAHNTDLATLTAFDTASGAKGSSYVLNTKAGAATSLSVTESVSGTAPFAGNGVVKETVVFNGATDKDKLVVSSVTSSVNVADAANATSTEFGSSVDAINQNRSVTYVNPTQKITSVYNFGTKHAFSEATNGNQAFSDGTDKVYSYDDAAIKIVSHSKTASEARTSFVNGAESLVKNASVTYSFADKANKSALDYVVAQNTTSNTTGAITTQTTVTNIPKFSLTDNSVAANPFKVDLTNGNGLVHKEVFNANGNVNTNILNTTNTLTSETFNVGKLALHAFNTDFDLTVAKFLPAAGSVTALLNAATGDVFDQKFDTSFKAVTDSQMAAVKDLYLQTDGAFRGTADNDVIKILSAAGKIVSALAGNDTVTGNAGNDSINGGDGSDVLTGGAGADVFRFAPIRGALANIGKDTIADFKTTDGDKIDLKAIDAKSSTSADEAFTLLAPGTTFTAEGQLRFNAANNTLEGNTDANSTTVEFSVVLTGVAAVVATDFVL